MAQSGIQEETGGMMGRLEEILRCLHCGFRIRGQPVQYLSRRTVLCPLCRGETPLSLEGRIRLKRLAAAARAEERAPGNRAAGEG